MGKIIVWGMGKLAASFIEAAVDADYEVIAVTATKVDETQSEFMGIPIIHCEHVKDYEYDYLVIESKTHYDEIMETVRRLQLDLNKTFAIDRFLADIIYAEKYKDNDLYKFFMNEPHNIIDKWFHYFEVYDLYFKRFRNKNIVFCEVGVFKGGSLQMWQNYFGENAQIIGVDVDEKCKKYEERNVSIEIGDQADPAFWSYFKKKYPKVDVLLDDGGHMMNQQIVTFENMFPHISKNGIYMCEDMHTSYWESHRGGYRRYGTGIEYFKGLVDSINAILAEEPYLEVGYNTRNIGGLHFYDSIVVVEKSRVRFDPIREER